MRKFALLLISTALVPIAGCGCLEKYTDPRLMDNPYTGEDAMRPRDPIDFPDTEQPAWHRCVFGTRWLPRSSAIASLGEPDLNQPAWHRRLFGPRYLPRDRMKDDALPPGPSRD